MDLKRWHIHGHGFHWGRHGLGQEETSEYVVSDTLFAALVSRLVALRGMQAVEAFVEPLRSEAPPYVLSSAFPRAGEVCFFPKPLLLARAEQHSEGPKPKALKKVHFVSEQIYLALLAGGDLAEHFSAGETLNEGRILLTKAEWSLLPPAIRDNYNIWKIEKRPRVTIGREVANSQIYHTGLTAFAKDCGLWFSVRWFKTDPKDEETLNLLLHDLGEAGLGGERSSGFGHYQLEDKGQLSLPDPVGGLWTNLSRYIPRSDEMQALLHPSSAYQIERVGGWVYSPGRKSERRRTVNMLTEGSVLGSVGRVAPGQIVDVQPEYDGKKPLGHPVWRCGLALAVGLNGGGS